MPLKDASQKAFSDMKAMGDPKRRDAVIQVKRNERIAEANARTEAATARVEAVNGNQ